MEGSKETEKEKKNTPEAGDDVVAGEAIMLTYDEDSEEEELLQATRESLRQNEATAHVHLSQLSQYRPSMGPTATPPMMMQPPRPPPLVLA